MNKKDLAIEIVVAVIRIVLKHWPGTDQSEAITQP